MSQWISNKQSSCKSFCEIENFVSMVNHWFIIIIINVYKKEKPRRLLFLLVLSYEKYQKCANKIPHLIVSDFFYLHKGKIALSAKLEVSLVEVPLGAFAGLFYFLNVTTERKGLNKISCLEWPHKFQVLHRNMLLCYYKIKKSGGN